VRPPLYLLEPSGDATAWAPFAGTRPIAELRAGASTLRHRWEVASGTGASGLISEWLDLWHEFDDQAPLVAAEAVRGPALVARSDVAIAWGALALPPEARRLTIGADTVAWLLADGEPWTGPGDAGPAHPVEGFVLDGAYDLVSALERVLRDDCARASRAIDRDPLPPDALILGTPEYIVTRDADIEPGVVFDTRQGGIVIESGAEIRHGSRIEGPCWIGPHSKVVGGFIRSSVLGPWCVIRGEVSTSCFTGYTNKAHDGFVGHTVTGHWVNLGAGTTTSNLKNTYGPVRLDVGDQRIETGRQMLGSLIGDHAKTAIGTMLATGTVVGAGANVVGGQPPKYVPPFAWGARGTERMTLEGFLAIAERVLPRRAVEWTPARRDALAALHHRLTA
jgi:UDP-N-acetylglucosamine diphosphorylase/glucosamine-1-phosphate N-acetyltransferase